MLKFSIKLAISVSCLFISGCMSLGGTFADERCNKIYVGTSINIDYLVNNSSGHGITNVPFIILDFPFSLVMDTLLLPYTIPKSMVCTKNNSERVVNEIAL
jgi:uncharacterized protein YceK